MGAIPVIFRSAVALAALWLLTACAGPPNQIGLGESQLSLATEAGAKVQTLYLATSRLRSDDDSEFYSGARAQEIGLGNVAVTIPPNHQPGSIEKSRRSADIARHFTIADPQIFGSSASFTSAINQALAARPKGNRDILVFVHGYNTNFTEAVLRISQFVHDTGFKGVPVLFTWASRGKRLDYLYDMNSALQARYYLAELAKILARTNAEHFNVVAHSMGNLVTLEAMTQLAKSGFKLKVPLHSVVLAAPDVDLDLFVEYVEDLGRLKDNFYVLVSKDDKALQLSSRIAGGVARAGAAEPEVLAALGLTVVDLSDIQNRGGINHSKFTKSPEIVQLIGKGINAGGRLSTSSRAPTQEAVGTVLRGVTSIPSRLVGRPLGQILTLGN